VGEQKYVRWDNWRRKKLRRKMIVSPWHIISGVRELKKYLCNVTFTKNENTVRTECISGKKNPGSESGDQTGSFHEKKLGDENLVQAYHLTNIKRS
jgi:hypothetical protein